MEKIFYKILGVNLGLVLVAGVVFGSAKVSADTVDTVNVTVPEACTLTTQAGAGQVYAVDMQNGQYKNDIGKTRLSVFCNTQDSFSIYAVGYSSDDFGNTAMVTASTGTTNIATGTATSGDTSNWAMKIETVTGTGSGVYTPVVQSPFNDFASVPDTWVKIAEVASATGTTVEGAIDASYAIYIAPGQQSGSYTGKVRYTVVHPASEVPNRPYATQAGKIGYYPNANGTVADTMGDQDGQTMDINAFVQDCNNANGNPGFDASGNIVCTDNMGDPINITIKYLAGDIELWASNFKRPGYGFAGWSDAYDYKANVGSESNPSARIFGPNETVTPPSDVETNGWSLYAVWVKSAGTLQNWTGCGSLSVGQVTALTDNRDNQVYAVAKLADGKCWMIENLRLGGTMPMTLTPANTNITSDFTLSAGSGASAWCTDRNEACIDQSLVSIDSTTNPVANMTTNYQLAYSQGHFYNWYSAAAGTRSYNDYNEDNATGSICPAGWRLPTGWLGTDRGDFYRMVSAVSGKTSSDGIWDDTNPDLAVVYNSIKSYPNNFILSGVVSNSTVVGQGVVGVYWSSTSDSNDAQGLHLNPSDVNAGDVWSDKVLGYSVRCVFGL